MGQNCLFDMLGDRINRTLFLFCYVLSWQSVRQSYSKQAGKMLETDCLVLDNSSERHPFQAEREKEILIGIANLGASAELE
jgi:hypothetical protein